MASNILLGFDIVNFVSENNYETLFLLIASGIIIGTFLIVRHINKREKEEYEKKKNEEKLDKSEIKKISKSEIEKFNISVKIDCLKHLSKIHRSQFDERRKIEWKLIFAILVFYFGIITAKITSTNKVVITSPLKVLISSFFFIIAAFAICYLTYFHLANHKNKFFAQNSGDAIRDLLKGKVPNFDIFEFEWKDILSNWSFKMQIALLFSMAFCSSAIIWI
ncbi:hypothetical protein KJA15_00210 [Patescibacteria group bacterium]|nr:hypothetical protein [Patescibacteria group bacterium]